MNKFDKSKKSIKGREFQGKRKIYSNYTTRNFPKETSVFNTEELAALYHFLLTDVKTPRLQKADLPTLSQSN